MGKLRILIAHDRNSCRLVRIFLLTSLDFKILSAYIFLTLSCQADFQIKHGLEPLHIFVYDLIIFQNQLENVISIKGDIHDNLVTVGILLQMPDKDVQNIICFAVSDSVK